MKELLVILLVAISLPAESRRNGCIRKCKYSNGHQNYGNLKSSFNLPTRHGYKKKTWNRTEYLAYRNETDQSTETKRQANHSRMMDMIANFSKQNVRNKTKFKEILQAINCDFNVYNCSRDAVGNVTKFVEDVVKGLKNAGTKIHKGIMLKVTKIISSVLFSLKICNESAGDEAHRLDAVLGEYASLVEIPKDEYVSVETDVLCSGIADASANEDTPIELSHKGAKLMSVVIPKHSLPKDKNKTRLSVVAFWDTTLFMSSENLAMVVSIMLGKEEVRNLTNRITIEFSGAEVTTGRHPINGSLKVNKTTIVCKYFNEETAQWQTDGCYLDQNQTIPTCEVEHLTNFAIIVNSNIVLEDIELTIASKVGCGLSIVGLAITIGLYIYSRKWKRNRPAMEMLHVCFNLMMAYIIFLAGVSSTDHRGQCIATAAALQYFYLSTWLWIGIYTRDMYISLVTVFDEQSSNYLAKLTGLAYSLPLVIVVVHVSVTTGYFDNLSSNTIPTTEGVSYMNSTYVAENVCWLHSYSLYLGFLLPVSIILLHNLISFALIIYEITWKAESIDTSAKTRTAISKLKLVVTVGTLVGMTWIFAFLLFVSEDKVYSQVMSWLFALFNSLQGFAMFIILCVRSKDIRETWWKPLRNKLLSLSTNTDPTS